MTTRWSPHSPEAVQRAREAFFAEPFTRLVAAVEELDDFRLNYFLTGDIGSLTRLIALQVIRERRARRPGGRNRQLESA